MSNEAPAIDWAVDVQRYVPAADTGAIKALVHHCLVTQKTREAPLVSFAKPAETRSVRDNFCKKTLGLTESDGALDAAIASVGTRMSDTTSRHRVTAYYLLAEHFGKVGELAAAAAAMPPARVPPILAPWAADRFEGPPPGTAGADLMLAAEAPAIDWADDVKRYVPAADNGAIAGLVRHCLVSQKTREAPLVSFGQPSETRSVRENFCKKTLGLTESDGALDAAIASVGARMSDTTSRHRVTAYYLLAEHFGKLEQFAATAAATPPAPVAAPLAPWAATMFDGPPPSTASGGPSTDLMFAAAVGLSGGALALCAAVASTAGG